MLFSDRKPSISFPHEGTPTRNIEKRHEFPHSTVAATQIGALNANNPNRKWSRKNQILNCKWHIPSIHPILPAPPTPATTRTRTHLVRGILVGAGIQQQPCAVQVTIMSGIHQRRPSFLRRRRRRRRRRRNVNRRRHQPPADAANAQTCVRVVTWISKSRKKQM